MKFKELKENDKPRERLIEKGVEALSDAELLAIILRTGTHNKDVIDLANSILIKYPFNRLKDLLYEQLIKLDGVKSAKACSILALFEIAKRSYIKNIKEVSFSKSKDIYDYIYSDIVNETKEILIVIYLDIKLKMLKMDKFYNYNPNSINVPIKRIIQVGLNLDSSNIILIHNHPSGDYNPSKSDYFVTKELFKILKHVDLDLIDHLIVTKKGYYSFSENGILNEEDEYDFLGDSF